MDIENIIDNLNLISSAIPDYSESRNRGLSDAESEKIAFEAISEAIESLEKLEIQNIDKLKILVVEQRILSQLLEVKTELQEQALGRTGASKRMCLAEIKGIDKGIEIVRKELEND